MVENQMKGEDREALLDRAAGLAIRLNSAQILGSSKQMAELISLGLEPKAVEEAQQTASAQLQSAGVRARICEALKTSSDDLRELTKVVGAALLPLILTGVISIPATPLGLAVAALFVYRLGISAYCGKSSDMK